ncbi:MAG: chemotaxis protein CheW [Methylococcales bacterium]
MVSTTPAAQQPHTLTAARQSTAGPGQYLTFLLKGETYALGILSIKEIIGYERLTEVPMMPGFIRGVINLRGRVVPVVDLQARFGQGTTTVGKRTSIVIVEIVEQINEKAIPADMKINATGSVTDIGIIVDAVNEVVDIADSEIEPAPSFGTNHRPDFIIGMANQENQFIVMLAVDKVLEVNDMAELGQALCQANGLATAH